MTDRPATPGEVAEYLGTSVAALAQHRYRGTGPAFIKAGRKVLYRWSAVEDWLNANTHTITGSAA